MPRGRPKKSEKSVTTEPNLNPVIIENVKNETLSYPNTSKDEVYEIKGKVKTISAMSRQSISYRGNYYTFEYKEERELPINEYIDLIQEKDSLWTSVNSEVDKQINDMIEFLENQGC